MDHSPGSPSPPPNDAYLPFQEAGPISTDATFLDLSSATPSPDRRRATPSLRFLQVRLSVFSRMGWSSQAFVALGVLGGAALMAVGLTIVVVTAIHKSPRAIHDGSSPCNRVQFADLSTSSAVYQSTLILLGAVMSSWYAVRGAVLEKVGTLLCYVAIAAMTHARALYAVFGGLLTTYNVHTDTGLALQIVVGCGTCVWVASLWVARQAELTFGYRRYTKGFTQLDDVVSLRRSTQLDAVSKLDVYVSLCICVSIFFVKGDLVWRIVGATATSVTVVLLLLLWKAMKREAAVVLYLFGALGLVLPAVYVYVVASRVSEGSAVCLDDVLEPCLFQANVSMVPSSHAPPPYDMPSGSTEWSWSCTGCATASKMSPCIKVAMSEATSCCASYGHCLLRRELYTADMVLMIVLAAAGVVLRLVVYVAFFRLLQVLPNVMDAVRRGSVSIPKYVIQSV